MEFLPDKKLITKQWLTLATISLIIIIISILLYILLPLSPQRTADEISEPIIISALSTIAGIWIILVPIIIIYIKKISYAILDDRIIIRKGVLSKIVQNIPFRQITDFKLHRSLYDRFLGIASIKVQTAGQSVSGTGYEAKLSGLTNWDVLLEMFRKHIEKYEPGSSQPVQLPGNSSETLSLILQELREIKEIYNHRRG